MTINKKQTVLIITSHYPPNFGGVESHLQALVSGLIKSSWKVLISTYQPLASMVQAPYFENSKGVSVYRFPWLGFNIVHKLTHYPLLEFLYLFPGLFIISLFILIKQSYTQQQFLTGNYLFDALIFGSVIGALVNKYLFK